MPLSPSRAPTFRGRREGPARTALRIASAREAGGADADADALDAIARREGVRLGVVDAGGHVALDRDHDPATSLRDRIGDIFFGLEGAPSLRAYDDALPPLPERVEIAAARRAGGDRGCAVALGGKLLVCHASLAAAGGAVLAEKSSPRAIRALWDVRGPMLKLTMIVLFMALALAAWLGRAIVRPIERLRGEVLARSQAPLAGDAILATKRDEIGDLAAAFNVLLGAIAEKNRQNHAFMADLVHELKSPVAAVRAAAEALGDGPADEVRARRLGRVLAESGRRLDAVVTEFLELSARRGGAAQRGARPRRRRRPRRRARGVDARGRASRRRSLRGSTRRPPTLEAPRASRASPRGSNARLATCSTTRRASPARAGRSASASASTTARASSP